MAGGAPWARARFSIEINASNESGMSSRGVNGRWPSEGLNMAPDCPAREGRVNGYVTTRDCQVMRRTLNVTLSQAERPADPDSGDKYGSPSDESRPSGPGRSRRGTTVAIP